MSQINRHLQNIPEKLRGERKGETDKLILPLNPDQTKLRCIKAISAIFYLFTTLTVNVSNFISVSTNTNESLT